MGLRPIKDLAQLIPIGDLIEGQMLDRCAGDDQPVELLTRRCDLAEGAIELLHMRGGCVLRLVIAHPDEMQVDLQRCRPDQPGKLRLRLDFLWHQVQQPDAQRPDILQGCAIIAHHHHALAREHVIGGKRFGQFDRHLRVLLRPERRI